MLLDVFVQMKNNMPNLKLVYIGQGDLEKSCKEKVSKLGLESSVSFLGFCQNIEKVLPMLDLHVLLSKREGFGIATAEAMACGVPVVATNVPGSQDILRNSHAGLLVPPDDIDEIVAMISELIRNDEVMCLMTKAGPIEVEKRFSKKHIAKELDSFYIEALAS